MNEFMSEEGERLLAVQKHFLMKKREMMPQEKKNKWIGSSFINSVRIKKSQPDQSARRQHGGMITDRMLGKRTDTVAKKRILCASLTEKVEIKM